MLPPGTRGQPTSGAWAVGGDHSRNPDTPDIECGTVSPARHPPPGRAWPPLVLGRSTGRVGRMRRQGCAAGMAAAARHMAAPQGTCRRIGGGASTAGTPASPQPVRLALRLWGRPGSALPPPGRASVVARAVGLPRDPVLGVPSGGRAVVPRPPRDRPCPAPPPPHGRATGPPPPASMLRSAVVGAPPRCRPGKAPVPRPTWALAPRAAAPRPTLRPPRPPGYPAAGRTGPLGDMRGTIGGVGLGRLGHPRAGRKDRPAVDEVARA